MDILNVVGGVARVVNDVSNFSSFSTKKTATDALLMGGEALDFQQNELPFWKALLGSADNTEFDDTKDLPDCKIMSGSDLLKEYNRNKKFIEKCAFDLSMMTSKNMPSLHQDVMGMNKKELRIAQKLLKRNEIIINHCAKMQNEPDYRSKIERLQHENITSPDTQKALKKLTEENTKNYQKVTVKARKDQPWIKSKTEFFQKVSKKMGYTDPDSSLASRMGKLPEAAADNVRSFSESFPASETSKTSNKGLFSQFKEKTNVIQTMTAQLKIGEEDLKKFLNEVENALPKVNIKSDASGKMEMSSSDTTALCNAAKTLATNYAKDTVFDLNSPSAAAAFKILEKASDSLKIGTVTYLDENKKEVVLNGEEQIKEFIKAQKAKMQPSEPSPSPQAVSPPPGTPKPKKPGA